MALSIRRSSQPLPPSYVEVLRHIERVGHIRPVEAGLILYSFTENEHSIVHREKYASSDGSELLRRMALRGLIHREAPGRWTKGAPSQPINRRRSETRRHP